VLWAKTFNVTGIVEAQKGVVLGISAFGLHPLLFPIAVMFLISAMAETARAPFDLTEAESELVAGYQTEYSSMAFALYWLGEYANVLLMCTLNAILFWGGYLPPVDWAPLYAVPGIIWLFAKILLMFFIFAWVKATVPRYRYDQLMRLGWKVFLPISLFWVCLVSGYLMWKGHWGHASPDGTPIATDEVGYLCNFAGATAQKGELALVKKTSNNPALEDDQWSGMYEGKPLGAALKSEWGLSEGGSFALTWGKGTNQVTAYISFGDIPDEAGSQPMWVKLKQADGTVQDSSNCSKGEKVQRLRVS
jgi:hypothetical protein